MVVVWLLFLVFVLGLKECFGGVFVVVVEKVGLLMKGWEEGVIKFVVFVVVEWLGVLENF